MSTKSIRYLIFLLLLLPGRLCAQIFPTDVPPLSMGGSLDPRQPVVRGHPLAQGLLVWWLVAPGLSGGAQLYALVGQTHATLSGMTTAGGASGWSSTFRPGGDGELRLDGTDDYASAPQTSVFVRHALPFTLMAWVKDDTAGVSLATFHRIVSWYDGTANIQLGLGGFVGTTQRGFYLANATTGGLAAAVVSAAVPTGWHHVAVTFDGSSTYVLYLDGAASSLSDATTVGIYTGDATTIYLGQRGDPAGFLVGALDDVRLYDRALTAPVVRAIYVNSLLGLPGLLRRVALPTVNLASGTVRRKPVQWNWLFDALWRYAYVE